MKHQQLLTDDRLTALVRPASNRVPATQPIDPSDNDTFWHANEYYPATSIASWFTRRGKFNFAGAVPCGSPNTDFNHDDKPDYVLYNGGTHQTAVWYMNTEVFLLVAPLVRLFLVPGTWSRLERAYPNISYSLSRIGALGPWALVAAAFRWSHSR